MRKVFAALVGLLGLALGVMAAMKAIDGTFTTDLWASVLLASFSILLLAFAGRIALT